MVCKRLFAKRLHLSRQKTSLQMHHWVTHYKWNPSSVSNFYNSLHKNGNFWKENDSLQVCVVYNCYFQFFSQIAKELVTLQPELFHLASRLIYWVPILKTQLTPYWIDHIHLSHLFLFQYSKHVLYSHDFEWSFEPVWNSRRSYKTGGDCQKSNFFKKRSFSKELRIRSPAHSQIHKTPTKFFLLSSYRFCGFESRCSISFTTY